MSLSTVSSPPRLMPPVSVARLRAAEWMSGVFSKGVFQNDVRRFNMSLPDLASRFITLFSIYIPQAYLTIKNKKHPWEMNSRNALTWSLTVVLTALIKNDKTSLNTLFNVFMQPRRSPVELQRWKKDIWQAVQAETRQKYGRQGAEALATAEMRQTLVELRSRLDELLRNPQPESAKQLVDDFGPETLLRREPHLSALRPVLDNLEAISDAHAGHYRRIRRRVIRSSRRVLRELKKIDKRWAKLPAKIQKHEQKANHLLQAHGEDYAGRWSHRLINRFRLKHDYFRILKSPEIGLDIKLTEMLTAPWSKFDSNQFRHLQNKLKEFVAKQAAVPGTLKPIEREFVELMPKFLFRMNAFKLISSFVFIGLQAYLLGFAVMEFVNNTFARLDPDFDLNAKGGKPLKTPQWLKRFKPELATASSPLATNTTKRVDNPFSRVGV